MTTLKQLLFGAACLLAAGAQAATYDFTSGPDSIADWQPYTPLALFGVTATLSQSSSGYTLQSDPSVNPTLLGPARVGSFLPGNVTDFSISFDVPSYSATPSEFFGAAARVQNLGPGTSSGYLMGYDTSSGQLYITAVVNEVPQGGLQPSSVAPVTLVAGQGYRFVFDGQGTLFDGAVYSLSDLSTPLASVTGTDSQFTSGQAGLLVAAQTDTGSADATFSQFTLVPEPGTMALLALGGGLLWALRMRSRNEGTD